MRRIWTILLLMLATQAMTLLQASWADEFQQPAWGRIDMDQELGLVRLQVDNWPEDGRLPLPTPFPHLVRCFRVGQGEPETVDFQFNADATLLHLIARPSKNQERFDRLQAQVSETTRQFPDGRIAFSALDAQVIGETAKLEEHPGNYRIGFWSNDADYVVWNYNASRWGMYQVYLTYSTASPDGTEVQLELGGEKLNITLPSTGSWYRYTTIDAGKLYLKTAGKQQLAVRCVKRVGPAVMNLKAVLLCPACEGQPPVQGGDGAITLHGRDATVRGTTLRYEPIEKKRTLGYWVKSADRAEWSFVVTKPGKFDVEVLQGCGQGQGGSDVLIEVRGPERGGAAKPLAFVVEDTGHFQNFKARQVGSLALTQMGRYTLSVQPTKIAKNAALDLRQIRLIPSP